MPAKARNNKGDRAERLRLYRALQGLPAAHFDEILFALNPPAGIVSPAQTQQGTRTGELLGWAEGQGGCGLVAVYELLVDYVPDLPRPSASDKDPVPVSSIETSLGRLVISYKREMEPDEPLALSLREALGEQYTVFIDQQMTVGANWVEQIRNEIQQAEALIVLLSEPAVSSEMVQREVQMAHEFARTHGHPQILPVRLAYREPFQYPLSVYLDPIQWAFWESPADTPRLLEELRQALTGGTLPLATPADKAQIIQAPKPVAVPRPTPSAQPRSSRQALPLELPEGTMAPESQFYVARSFDQIAQSTIQQQGVTITIKGPRQMGKSSLLNQVMSTAHEQGKRVAFLDFQLFDQASLTDPDTFFPEFCAWLTDELDLEDQVDEYWKRRLSNTQRCTRYVGRYLLPTLAAPLVLAMDEVETMFDTEFRSDFFGMLRSWHNNRATKPAWKQLDLALVTSTEPYQLIDNLNQSPFNVGQIIELTDFDFAQVADLNQRHGDPLTASELQRLMDLVNGHPYLVRKALYLVVTGTLSTHDLFDQADKERGPFGDHLRYHLFRMYDKPELVQGFLQVIHTHTCADERVFFRLRGAGLVQRSSSNGVEVLPRCQLYEQYFQQHLG
ncbi:AAA-like domain-containing protein [Oscillatoria sp. CS-180]|uniref:AAA-like domain-containing protein n=1 Tax=Oscillatoria sp. CS-180 TaxID=3021720 RepID=UPI00232F8ACA|nr:AAA-like domain-containing protein [Oscillatoria sp. CS-180]MDB9527455.1 AAA-like domain-containing protein [Oscillatoria sp. CS-180]